MFNYRQLPLYEVAVLAFGLPDNARVKRLVNNGLSTTDLLLALAVDYLGLLVWFQTKDGQKNRNRPKSIYKELTKVKQEIGFVSGEDFEAERQRILKQLQES